MFNKYKDKQFQVYRQAFSYYIEHPYRLIEIEHFISKEILHFIDLHLPEIRRDYNEASYLYPFWKNYPPLDRGRSPKGDQYPWIEVGEQVFGNKLSRYFANNFQVKDSGLPSGSDDRCIISSEKIKEILGITDSVWVFIDIKSTGPRDDSNEAVMSPYQVSGSGDWVKEDDGLSNLPIEAIGLRASHNFYCSQAPIYVLSDGTIAPLVSFVIKPIYSMLKEEQSDKCLGQPLNKIKVASLPNGILLTHSPNYIKSYRGLFFPGKDDRRKNRYKARARVSFEILSNIDKWRVAEITVNDDR